MIAVVTTNALDIILTFISRPATRPTAVQKGVRPACVPAPEVPVPPAAGRSSWVRIWFWVEAFIG